MSYERVPTQEQELIPWEVLRKQARSLEQQIDSRLISLSQSIQDSQPSSNASNASLSLQQELTGLLSQLTRVTDDMQKHAERSPQQYTHLSTRHIANLYEYNREFNKTRVFS